jgi:hypothetical protein
MPEYRMKTPPQRAMKLIRTMRRGGSEKSILWMLAKL